MAIPWAGRPQSLAKVLLCTVLLSALSSCGYALVGASGDASHPRLPLGVVPLMNQTREPDLDRLTTAALRQALAHSPLFTYATDYTTARHVQGIIRRFRSFPLALDANDNVVQYRLEVDISIRLREAMTGQPVLEQDLSTAAVYLVSRATTDKVREDVAAREAAIARLAQQFAAQCLALLATTLL